MDKSKTWHWPSELNSNSFLHISNPLRLLFLGAFCTLNECLDLRLCELTGPDVVGEEDVKLGVCATFGLSYDSTVVSKRRTAKMLVEVTYAIGSTGTCSSGC